MGGFPKPAKTQCFSTLALASYILANAYAHRKPKGSTGQTLPECPGVFKRFQKHEIVWNPQSKTDHQLPSASHSFCSHRHFRCRHVCINEYKQIRIHILQNTRKHTMNNKTYININMYKHMKKCNIYLPTSMLHFLGPCNICLLRGGSPPTYMEGGVQKTLLYLTFWGPPRVSVG